MGLTAGELAAAARVSPTTVSKIETGGGETTTLRKRHQVAEALGWPPTALADIAAGAEADRLPITQPQRSVEDRLAELEVEAAELRDELRSQRQALDILLERTEHLRGEQ